MLVYVLQFLVVGRVTSIEINHKTVDKAHKGQEVCIKIEPMPGEAPKMFGRHFDETDLLVSKVRTKLLNVHSFGEISGFLCACQKRMCNEM